MLKERAVAYYKITLNLKGGKSAKSKKLGNGVNNSDYQLCKILTMVMNY